MPDPTAPAGTDDLHDQIRTALAGCVPFGEWDLDRKTRAVMTVVAPELERLRAELANAREERDQAIAHDRQPYPTADAYERACKALWHHRERADKAEVKRDALKAAIGDVRRLCEMTIATSCRVQAIDQAIDTLAVLDRALDTPDTAPEAVELCGDEDPAISTDGGIVCTLPKGHAAHRSSRRPGTTWEYLRDTAPETPEASNG